MFAYFKLFVIQLGEKTFKKVCIYVCAIWIELLNTPISDVQFICNNFNRNPNELVDH